MAQQRPASTIQTVEPSAVAVDGMFSDARIELIRNSVAKGAPDDVFAAMIDIAKRRNLDPLAKQIICAKFGGNWQMITTIDGYRSIAEQTGRYAGSDAPVFTWYLDPVYTEGPKGGKLIPESATVTVYKLIDGERYPFSATVYWEEYDGRQNNWVSMPRTMLAKVAESHALRKAFPAVLSGMYTEDEMDQASIETTARVVNRQTGEISSHPRALPSPMEAMNRLYTVAQEHGITHDMLHIWAEKKGYGSLNAVPTDMLMTMVAEIEHGPETAKRWFAKHMPPVRKDEPVEVSARADEEDEESRMNAAIANATPVLPGMDVNESGDPDRFTR